MKDYLVENNKEGLNAYLLKLFLCITTKNYRVNKKLKLK